ncbi:MAG: hypothetical protein IKA33_04860, partial [Candidatus Methanomethylophilaceae archaeon]|nr:hypothetical protein [Candidatus Methanomethylophilaceae archaeon]
LSDTNAHTVKNLFLKRLNSITLAVRLDARCTDTEILHECVTTENTSTHNTQYTNIAVFKDILRIKFTSVSIP